MALSLVHDFDLRCETKDIQRLTNEFPYNNANNLILMTDDDWQTVWFGKPYLISLLAAPAVALFGANGFLGTNMALLMLCIWLGALYLRRFNPDGLALLFSAGFFLLSNAFAYVFWIHTEVLCMASVTICLYLAFTPASIGGADRPMGALPALVLERGQSPGLVGRSDHRRGVQQADPGPPRAAGALSRLPGGAPARRARSGSPAPRPPAFWSAASRSASPATPPPISASSARESASSTSPACPICRSPAPRPTRRRYPKRAGRATPGHGSSGCPRSTAACPRTPATSSSAATPGSCSMRRSRGSACCSSRSTAGALRSAGGSSPRSPAWRSSS